jgi:hypothetical protein
MLTRFPLGQLSQPHATPHDVRLGMRTSVPMHGLHPTSSAVRVTGVAAARGDHKRRFAALAPVTGVPVRCMNRWSGWLADWPSV